MPETHGERAATRWAATDPEATAGYGRRFATALADGEDIDGEARLADVLLPRGGRVLDVGSGMGRVSAALAERGHDVTAIEPDPRLVAQSRATYPRLAVLPLDARDLSAEALGMPEGGFDLAVLVGNVMVYLAPDSEREVLARVAGLLAPGGRVLVGFHLTEARAGMRRYAPADFEADVAAAGLAVRHRFGGYDLRPADDEYAVWVLAGTAQPVPAG